MSLFSWFENLFGGKWTNETVVQYQGDTMEHAIGGYTIKDHISQLRNRRPSLHHTQRLLVDSKIRELEYELSLQIAREKEAERKREEANALRRREQTMYEQAHKSSRETSKPIAGNVIAKPPKFSVDVDDDAPTVSKARDTDNAGWHTHHTPTPSYTPSHSYSSHSSSHSCSSSSHSSSDSSSSSSGGGGCD